MNPLQISLDYVFDNMFVDTWSHTVTNSGLSSTTTLTGKSPVAVLDRGLYFNGSDHAELSSFIFNFEFTIIAWVRVQTTDTTLTVISITRDT